MSYQPHGGIGLINRTLPEMEKESVLAQAGTVIAREPTTLQLRYLETLNNIAAEKNSTIIFPVPINIFEAFTNLGRLGKALAPGEEKKK